MQPSHELTVKGFPRIEGTLRLKIDQWLLWLFTAQYLLLRGPKMQQDGIVYVLRESVPRSSDFLCRPVVIVVCINRLRLSRWQNPIAWCCMTYSRHCGGVKWRQAQNACLICRKYRQLELRSNYFWVGLQLPDLENREFLPKAKPGNFQRE